MSKVDTFTDADRRSETRVTTIYRPALIEVEGFAGFCLVRNLSTTGMMARVYTSLAHSNPVQIQFGDALTVPGQVVWCDHGLVGIRFDLEIDVEIVLNNLSQRSRRGKINRAPRLPIQASGHVVLDDRHIPVMLEDISQKGIKVRSSALKPGDEVTVHLPELESRKALVRWTQGDHAGLNFIRPIPYDQLGEWVVGRKLGQSEFSEPVAIAR